MKLNYKDIHVVEDFDEAQEFYYEHTNQPVEVGTAVAYDTHGSEESVMVCFDGIYHQSEHKQ